MKPKKIYYSISDVASLAKVKPYVLRYWETEFGQLKPKAMRGGTASSKSWCARCGW